eukprot:12812612-Alexandrium_andersonii.AAC.1
MCIRDSFSALRPTPPVEAPKPEHYAAAIAEYGAEGGENQPLEPEPSSLPKQKKQKHKRRRERSPTPHTLQELEAMEQTCR